MSLWTTVYSVKSPLKTAHLQLNLKRKDVIPSIKSAPTGSMRYQLFQALQFTMTADVIISTQNRRDGKVGM